MASHSASKRHVLTGLEVFLSGQSRQLIGKRVGLLTNTTGVDHHLRYTVDLLRAESRLRLEALFGPEHGILGDAQDGVPVANSVDRHTGLPIYSLFG
ncbi:MAG TPA: exo-beta-N-acetylmuramidase NamZ domain-containing protein, partial [Ktedonobacteraceae bacterium]